MSDMLRTQAMTAPPVADPNRTIMGSAPTLNATITIVPVQCPVCKTFNPPGLMFCHECGLIFDRALPGDAFGAPAVQLPCLIDPNGREQMLRPGVTVIGRQGDIAIGDNRVSRRHAQVTMENGTIQVEDLESTNGTKVSAQRIVPGEKATLMAGTKVSFGGYEMTLSLPGEAAKTAMGISGRTVTMAAAPTTSSAIAKLVGAGQEWPLEIGIVTFGRKADNPIAIVDPYVSGKHGQFEVSATGVVLTDLGSTNGTVVNDSKLAPNQPLTLTADDVIKLGALEFRVVFTAG